MRSQKRDYNEPPGCNAKLKREQHNKLAPERDDPNPRSKSADCIWREERWKDDVRNDEIHDLTRKRQATAKGRGKLARHISQLRRWFVDRSDFANASSAPDLIIRIKLMQAHCEHGTVDPGRVSEWRLRLTCAASPGAFDTVQVKELPSSVDHFADGLP